MAAVPAVVVLTPEQLADLVSGAVAKGVAQAIGLAGPVREAVRDHVKIGEAASALGVSTRQVRRLISAGRLQASKLATGGSSRVLIARAEIERLLSESAA